MAGNSQKVRNEHQLLSWLMKYIPDVIYFKDTAGRLILVNEAHAKGLGLKPQEVAGKTDFDIFPKERALAMAKDDRHVMTTGKAIIDKVERSTRPDGVDNYVSTTKIPRYDEKGNIIGLVGITRDITRRMQLERLVKEKEAVEKRLEASLELNRIKSEFVSVVSHEIRTPLAIIKEAVMLLLDELAGGINEKQKELLLKGRNNIERLEGIIEELLDISRIDSGRLKLHYSLVNLNDLLEELCDFFSKQAEDRGINLECIFPKEQVNIFLDLDRIYQVISNLISNAIKFTERNTSIKVELKVLQDRARVGVIDAGVGIAKADLPKLFNKFIQVSGISKIERKGLGLGLSIAKELVTRHGGEIWVESRLGVGSKFYFTIPRLPVLSILDRQEIARINHLLAQAGPLYFVNLLILNFGKLKKNKEFKPEQIFKDLKDIIQQEFKRNRQAWQAKPEIVSLDSRYGECSFLLPTESEEKVDRFNKALLGRLNSYFLEAGLNIFINTGITAYPKLTGRMAFGSAPVHIAANLKVKNISIGTEIRRSERIRYKLDMQAILSGSKPVSSKAVDISTGGICFYSPKAFLTDAEVEVRLKIPNEKTHLSIKGCVRWIREISAIRKQYKIGLEFIHPDKKAVKIISKFVKSSNPKKR